MPKANAVDRASAAAEYDRLDRIARDSGSALEDRLMALNRMRDLHHGPLGRPAETVVVWRNNYGSTQMKVRPFLRDIEALESAVRIKAAIADLQQ